MGMSCHAQIQNKIFDFVLGQSTKQEIKNYFNTKPDIEWEEEKTDETISAMGLRFGGCYWDIVFLDFYKDVLSTIYFSAIDTEDVSEADIIRNWEKLKQNLNKKYSTFLNKEVSTDEHLIFMDGKMLVGLQIQDKDGRKTLSLTYKDIELSLAQQKGEADEL